MDMMAELYNEITRNLENEALRVIVLSSTGPVFSAGHNLKEISDVGPEKSRKIFDRLLSIIKAIQKAPVPVIAKVDGLVTGAGCQLIASCDMVICSERSSFRLATADIGIFASTPAVAITRVMPRMKSFHMLFTGLPLNSSDAYIAGLVSCVARKNDLDNEVALICENISNKSRIVMQIGKQFFYKQLEMDIWDAYMLAEEVLVKNLKMNDAQEGLESFFEKRSPKWTNS
ncbi:enoyl-CoA hydratase domain-containing protein 3, mitochondrial-like isoform X3 [Condylostylus longicornis]|nr:enoyl-CoA hydratase domain-containing protein 3, mitochondrial-like isoform X3 [Condylostylus longicornis]